jgi:hypothetical protein
VGRDRGCLEADRQAEEQPERLLRRHHADRVGLSARALKEDVDDFARKQGRSKEQLSVLQAVGEQGIRVEAEILTNQPIDDYARVNNRTAHRLSRWRERSSRISSMSSTEEVRG